MQIPSFPYRSRYGIWCFRYVLPCFWQQLLSQEIRRSLYTRHRAHTLRHSAYIGHIGGIPSECLLLC